MNRTETWPILYEKILRVGNPDHYVGVATLWSERDLIRDILDPKEYCAIGNLYSAAGINHVIRNVWANPSIRYIVMWGMDMSSSGSAFVNFMKNGIDDNRQIIGSRGEIEKEIPLVAVNKFRESIELLDMRRKTREEIAAFVKTLPYKPPFATKPEVFPASEPDVKFLPSEQVGFRVAGKTVAQTWLKIVNTINNYGRIKTTRYASTNELKEILNLTAVVTDEDSDSVYFPEYLPFSKAELLAYYPEWMTARRLPDMAYNYGERLRDHNGIDQIENIKKLLQTRPDSKKMIAVTPKVSEDWSKVNNGDTPCLTQIVCGVQDSKFFLTAHFGSQDMFHGWPRNMFAARKMQKEIADSAGYPLGPCVTITHSAHIYSDDWKTMQELLEKYYLKELGYSPTMHFQEDPRGNWLVDTDEKTKQIVAKLFTPDMQTQLKIFHGPTAKAVYWQIFDWDLVNLPSHAVDLGCELQKAEIALRLGIPYQQDRPLNFTSLKNPTPVILGGSEESNTSKEGVIYVSKKKEENKQIASKVSKPSPTSPEATRDVATLRKSLQDELKEILGL